MLYKLAHILQSRLTFIWTLIEWLNALLFALRYRTALQRCSQHLAQQHLRLATTADAEALAGFFARQPEGAFRFFRPHAFDATTLHTLLGRRSWIMFVAEEEERIVGYGFLRCFFIGKSYLGKMVDHQHQGRGIAQRMCLSAMAIATDCGLHMYESINRENMASLRSSQKVLHTEVLEELEDGDMLIEDTPL